MAKLDGVPLGLSWVHVDMTHNRANDFLENARAKCAERVPGATMSVNTKLDGTQALVKVTVEPSYFDTLPANIRAAIIRVYTEAEREAALALVTTVEWAGPPLA